MNNRERIIDIVRRLARKPVECSPEESLFESGLLDSFTLPELVNTIESEFSIRIPDSDLTPRKFDSIIRIEAYIQSRF